MVVKPGPDPSRLLVLVSLVERHREYYLVDDPGFTALDDVVCADWADDGKLLVATRSGRLRVLGRALETLWEYDMDRSVAEPEAAPDWARQW
jgi:hypothetical protein